MHPAHTEAPDAAGTSQPSCPCPAVEAASCVLGGHWNHTLSSACTCLAQSPQAALACMLPPKTSPHQGYATRDRASGQWPWGHSQAGFSAWWQSNSSARNGSSGRRASNHHPNPSQGMSRVFALMGSRVRVHKPLGTAGLHGRRGYLLVHLLIPLRLSTLARELPGAPALPHRWGREKATSRSLPT